MKLKCLSRIQQVKSVEPPASVRLGRCSTSKTYPCSAPMTIMSKRANFRVLVTKKESCCYIQNLVHPAMTGSRVVGLVDCITIHCCSRINVVGLRGHYIRHSLFRLDM